MKTEPFPLHQLKPHSQGGAILGRAAESIALSTGQHETIVDVLHGRAFRYYAEGLRQYLAVRSGSVDFSRESMAKLRAFVARSESASLVAPPGIRARLYRAARSYLTHQNPPLRLPSREESEKLPWRAAPSAHLCQNPLGVLRFELKPEDAEILELRYARELSVEELSFVLKVQSNTVVDKLEAAKARAQLLIEPMADFDDQRFQKLVIEAYALQPQTDPKEREQEVEPLPSGTIIGGRYAVQVRVGLGAFGDVYRANDTEVPGHVVALKLLHQPAYSDSARQSALRELRLIASVFHPSIVQFKDHGWHEGRLWFVMPWYEGETLESRMQREPLNRKEARRIFEPLARALAAMHAAGVRHQDVKPDNVFLARIPGFGDEEVLPVLLDLGVAATDAEMVVAGTPTYFAPEVAAQFASVEDRPPVTPKADVFALALTLRNALEPETQEDVAAGAVEAFIENRARELPQLPSSKKLRFLNESFDRWLNLKSDVRPTADELADDLAILTLPEDRRARVRSIMRWAAPMIALLLLATGSTVGIFYEQARVQREAAAKAQSTAADLRVNLASTMETAQRLQGQVEQSQLTRAQLLERHRKLATEFRKTQMQVADRQKQLERTKRELQDTVQIKNQTEAALQTMTSRADILGEQLTTRQQRVAELRGDLAGLQATLQAEAKKAKQLERSVAAAVSDRARAEADLEHTRGELERLKAQHATPAPKPVLPKKPAADPKGPQALEPSPVQERPIGR